jgi:hypothetical protein
MAWWGVIFLIFVGHPGLAVFLAFLILVLGD